MNKVQFKINTVTEGNKIIQTTQDPWGKVMRQVVDTQEREARMALIKLGWTPPSYDKNGMEEMGNE